jgi:hypothetical protein
MHDLKVMQGVAWCTCLEWKQDLRARFELVTSEKDGAAVIEALTKDYVRAHILKTIIEVGG